MTVRDLIETGMFQIVSEGERTDAEIDGVFCCDLLSIAMAKGTPGAAWVTVMANVNALAVCKLTDMAAIVLAEGAMPDDVCMEKAHAEGVTVLSSKAPVFDCALRIHGMLH